MRIRATAATTLAIAAVTAAMLAGPARAQQNSTDPLQLKYAAEQEEKARIEREYNVMMQKTQRGTTSQTKADPWARVRPSAQNPKDKQ